MGTFMGHVLPGSFFILFGIWHIVNIYIRFFKCKLAGRRFFAPATFPCFCSKYPMEPILKIAATTIGSLGEIITGYRHDSGTIIPGNSQHVTMFSAFGLTGVVDLLVYYKVLWIPPKSDYAMSSLAFTVEGLLFAYHQHGGHGGHGGHQILEMTVHALLLYIVMSSAAVVLAEIVFPHSFLLTLCRGLLLLIQGTWFIQVGFILFPPWVEGQVSRWDMASHHSAMYSVMMYCFNIFACLAITGITGTVVKRVIAPDQLLLRVKNSGGASSGNPPGLMDAESHSDSECDLFVPPRPSHRP